MKKTFLLFAIILSCYSCKDKTLDDFFAGKTDGVIFIDFDPDINFTWPKMKDSIDIDQDSKYEIFFEVIPFAIQGVGFIFSPAIRSTSNLNIILDNYDNMPVVLSSGDFINNSEKWSTADTLIRLYYFENLSSGYRTIGHWKDHQDKYLGIKYKNKLGWIKISTAPEFLIKEIGLEK
jgi:hypothetical protein